MHVGGSQSDHSITVKIGGDVYEVHLLLFSLQLSESWWVNSARYKPIRKTPRGNQKNSHINKEIREFKSTHMMTGTLLSTSNSLN